MTATLSLDSVKPGDFVLIREVARAILSVHRVVRTTKQFVFVESDGYRRSERYNRDNLKPSHSTFYKNLPEIVGIVS